MVKPKAKSLQQKLGFFDEDLKNPDHDTILKWLDENIEAVIEDIYDLDWDSKTVKSLKNKTQEIKNKELNQEIKNLNKKKASLNQAEKSKIKFEKELFEKLEKKKNQVTDNNNTQSESIKEQLEEQKNEIEDLRKEISFSERKIKYLNEFEGLNEDVPQRKISISKISWEYTITNQTHNRRTGYQSSKSIIGFIDMKVDYIWPRLTVAGLDLVNEKIIGRLQWNQAEGNERYPEDKLSRVLFIEVKTKVPSLGELFRQLNTYREYVTGDFLVVCPDDSNSEMIKKQGFLFYKYK